MVFQPVVAGAFYTDNPTKLQQMVERYIDDAELPGDLGEVFGIVSPHAGYIYSGPVAGTSFRAVQGKKYDVVVVMGLSHRVATEVSVLMYDRYATPLGEVVLDREMSRKLIENAPWISDSDFMFRQEHSLEVELPFIQIALPNTKVVMVGIGTINRSKLKELAQALDKTFAGKKALFVASTDLSHFRTYDSASQMDRETLRFLENGDLDGLHALRDCRERMCGLGPVTTLYELYKLRGGNQYRILTYQNSGDTAGDHSRVVGYGSVALLGDLRGNASVDAGNNTLSESEYLTDDDKKTLLQIARETVETYVRSKRKPNFAITSKTLREPGAAFVTLHKKNNHQLRGCIGHVIATLPLWECVREMAVAASTQDPRFSPVNTNELDNLHIEISVLTKPVRVQSIDEIKVGEHGLIMSRGFQRGLLLPQVPTEWGWDRDTFLDQTCIKAGMNPGCWRDPDTTIERFSAVVFAE